MAANPQYKCAQERDTLNAKVALVEKSYAELQEQALRAQSENAKLMVDMQALEAQGAELTRRLHASEEGRRVSTTDNQTLTEQLHSTRMVLSAVERSREQLQRDSTGA